MSTTISSRTPEGELNHCPICNTLFRIEPSRPPGDAPCPSCGSLLWFSQTSEGVRIYDFKEIAPTADRVVKIVCENLGVTREQVIQSTSFIEDVGADSLDIVELVMALEEEFGVQIPEGEAEQIKTVDEAIDYFQKRLR